MEICRGRLMSRGIILVLVLAVHAAAELYDEDPSTDLDGDVILTSNGFLDMEPVVPHPVMTLDDAMKQLFLYKAIKSIGTSEDRLTARKMQLLNPFEDKPLPILNSELIKLSNVKRSADTKGIVVKPQTKVVTARPTNKPPKKPKTRGIYIGSQFICYLKICNLLTKYNNKIH